MNKIKIAIVGIGNCASSLIQGIHYYDGKNPEDAIGLMHWDIGGYKPSDIDVVAAFDVDERKVGKTIDEAIFAKPNCTTVFQKDIPKYDAKVSMGHVLDGVAEHMSNYDDEYTFVVSDEEPEIIAAHEKKIDAAARSLGSDLPNPMMYMFFLPITAIPDYAITDVGPVDYCNLTIFDPILNVREK